MKLPSLPTFIKEEDGVATVHGIYWLVAMLLLSGVALDGANGWRIKAQVRAATDAASLAAARHLDDVDAARTAAVDVAAMNLPSALHGTVIGPQDVAFGHYDGATGLFVLDEANPTAVKVVGVRSADRGNGIDTYLLGMVSQTNFELNTLSIASQIVIPEPPSDPLHPCGNITVYSAQTVEMVGNAEARGAVCLHGDQGVSAGSNNLLTGGVKASAPDIDTVFVTGLRAGSDDPDDIAVEAAMDPQILPRLAGDFVTTWNTLWALPDGATYSGPLIPSTISTNGGPMTIRKVDDWWWQVKKNQTIHKNSIYLVNHGMKFQNGVNVQNAAFIVRGTVDLGGSSSTFRKNYIFAEDSVDVQGNSTIGSSGFCATGTFDTYLLSPGAVKFRGGATVHGLVAAAPTMDTTGNLTVTGGLIMEAGNDVKLRGANNMTACATNLSSHYPVAQPKTAPVDPEDEVVAQERRARVVR